MELYQMDSQKDLLDGNLYAMFLRVLMCLASFKCWSCLSWSLATCLHSLHTTSLSIQLLLLTKIFFVSMKHVSNVKEVSTPAPSHYEPAYTPAYVPAPAQ